MSLISILKSKLRQFVPAEAGETQTGQEDILDVPPSPMLDQGMPIEVMKDFDTGLLFGRLEADASSSLTIGRISGEESFPVCQAGSAVLVRGYDAWMNPVLLRGRVACSSEAQCVVGNLKRISYETQRGSVRHPLTPPVGACVLDDAAPDQPEPCQLLNISVSGACIVLERSYQVGQLLRLRLEPRKGAGHATVYHCRVIRAAPRRGGYNEYGLLFTEMDEDSRNHLIQDIQTIRQEIEKKLLR